MSFARRVLRRVRDTGARRGARHGRSGPARSRYLDPRTERRDEVDDTHSLDDNDAIRIEYRPDRDGDPDPGEVVWTWIPYDEDPTQGKDRPAVIIGRLGDDLVGVPLTSKRRRREPQIPIGSGSWDRRGRASFARVDRVMAVDAEAIRREGAVLDRHRFDAVVDAVDERYRVIRLPR